MPMLPWNYVITALWSLAAVWWKQNCFSISPDEYPPVRDFDDIEPIIFNQSVLKKLFQRTSFAICTDQSRYNLTGLLLETRSDGLRVVATDGRRMSLAVSNEDVPTEREIKVIIPSKMIHELGIFA
jgi:DNA polymerase III subunit beta